jgi:hypothetical protein
MLDVAEALRPWMLAAPKPAEVACRARHRSPSLRALICGGLGVGGFAVLIKKYGVSAFGDNIGEDQDADKNGHHQDEEIEGR